MQTGAVKFGVRQKRLWLYCFLTLCFVSIRLDVLFPVHLVNAADIQRAREHGFAPGADSMFRGLQNGLGWIARFQRISDWTDVCIAVTDPEMDPIWRAVPDGTPIEIRPRSSTSELV